MRAVAHTIAKVVVIVAISIGIVYVAQSVVEDCSRRVCPTGTRARMMPYEGCVCIGRAR